MRLKLFEEYKDKVFKYYYEILDDEYRDRYLYRIEFDMERVISLFINGLTTLSWAVSRRINNVIIHTDSRISISESYDEWYIVSIEKYNGNDIKYYKCDQFEGLSKLIKDLKLY